MLHLAAHHGWLLGDGRPEALRSERQAARERFPTRGSKSTGESHGASDAKFHPCLSSLSPGISSGLCVFVVRFSEFHLQSKLQNSRRKGVIDDAEQRRSLNPAWLLKIGMV